MSQMAVLPVGHLQGWLAHGTHAVLASVRRAFTVSTTDDVSERPHSAPRCYYLDDARMARSMERL
jgi:hypothetical protein